MAPSMLCHRHAMPSRSSYPARPARQIASNTPAFSQSRKRLWIALALPKRSLGSAFHWQPVRRTKTIASNTTRAGFAGRPAPGLRVYFFLAGRVRAGINGSTRCQNASVTSQASARFPMSISPDTAPLRFGKIGYTIYGQALSVDLISIVCRHNFRRVGCRCRCSAIPSPWYPALLRGMVASLEGGLALGHHTDSERRWMPNLRHASFAIGASRTGWRAK